MALFDICQDTCEDVFFWLLDCIINRDCEFIELIRVEKVFLSRLIDSKYGVIESDFCF